jgi:hypothetical protein
MSALLDILTKKTVTIQDFSAFLKIDKRTLLNYRHAGKVPAPDIKAGNFVRWIPKTISKWTKGQKQHGRQN